MQHSYTEPDMFHKEQSLPPSPPGMIQLRKFQAAFRPMFRELWNLRFRVYLDPQKYVEYVEY